MVWNRRVGPEAYLLRLEEPVTAAGFRPGQFVNIRVSPEGTWDPLLRRPFSIMRRVLPPSPDAPVSAFDLYYVVVGRGTAWLSGLQSGDPVDLLGPLGNGFLDPELGLLSPPGRILLVAGGYGVAPFFGLVDALLDEFRRRDVVLLFGARTRELLSPYAELSTLKVRQELATDDGSCGSAGPVTGVLERVLAEEDRHTTVVACGPDAMMREAARLATAHGARCLVSLENEMACGVGICYGCAVAEPQPDGSIRYLRSCMEGPILDARRLGWQADGIGD